MKPLPAQDLRGNLATWAVPTALGPAVAAALLDALPAESYDPTFQGQRLETTYFDTPGLALRRARRKKNRYLTLRVRCYRSPGGGETYALSAKTEDRKFRAEIGPLVARALLTGRESFGCRLPAELLARLIELTGGGAVAPVVTVRCRRYAAEDEAARLTLDTGVTTDTGLWLPYAVLELKGTKLATPPAGLAALALRPIKLSKFLWATGVGDGR
jgi:hypothetical protein